jgi:hypothetical protein
LNHAARLIRARSATSTSRPDGSAGIRTPTSLIKSQVCSRYTTEPKDDSRVCVWLPVKSTSIYSCMFVTNGYRLSAISFRPNVRFYFWPIANSRKPTAQSGSPGNRTQRSGLIRATWATSPRLPFGCRPSIVALARGSRAHKSSANNRQRLADSR